MLTYMLGNSNSGFYNYNDNLFVILWFVIVLVLYFIIVKYTSMWFIFGKAGEKGWKALIPLYNIYLLYKISFQGKENLHYFIEYMLFSVLTIILPTFLILSLIIKLTQYYKLGKTFGKKTWFCICTALVPIIFMPIIAFDSSNYLEKEGDDYGM